MMCDEANDRCVECFVDSDCTITEACMIGSCNAASGACEARSCFDNLFCNGREICNGFNACSPGIPPCSNPEICVEGGAQCSECESDDQCDDADSCSIDRCDAWRSCRSICTHGFDSPSEGSVFPIGNLVDVIGRGPRGLDLILVLDESGSVDGNEFAQLKEFARSIVQSFTFGENAAKVGVTMFSSGARRVLDLNANQSFVSQVIMGMNQRAGATCIGCGIDDGVANLLVNGRPGAAQIIIVVTDGQNNQPSNDAFHLQGALAAAGNYGHVLLGVGVGDVNLSDIQLIATDIPGVQTAFLVSGYNSIGTILNSILIAAGSNNMGTIPLILPDGSETSAVVGPTGFFIIEDWPMLPGENIFEATITTVFGPLTATRTLIGNFPCKSICGDLTGDGAVNLLDVSESMLCFTKDSWDSPVCGCADLNGDLTVDLADHALFVGSLLTPTSNVPPHCQP